MDILGSLALLLAFLAAVYAVVAGIVGIVTRRVLLTKSARNAGMAVFVLVTIAVGCLEFFFFTNNFSLAYVAEHSNTALPPYYKFAALWAGQEGSLLLWTWLLSVYAFFVLFLNRKRHPELMPYAGVVMAGVQTFFLTLNNFVATPFQVVAGADGAGIMHLARISEGRGLNPLLQYPEMVIHPPMLYLGYTGFTIPFAFALAALLGRYPGEKWIHITRRWTMIAWCFQSIGILLGAHWAYAVLGWGGYWAWDPVENASLLPWITGTAFLHSVMMQEKRGMMKVWNVWLVFTTFMLCILGTLLTRSGVVSSVHAFAQSSIGGWFVGFLIIVFLVCAAAYWKNHDYLRSDNQLDSLVSRESSFLFNNLILLAACFAVLWGTLFPVLSEWVEGSKISVGPPFFNKVMIPIALFLLMLTGVGPLLAWRKTSFDALKRNFAWPLGGGVVAGVVALIFGFRDVYALMCLILSVFVTLTIASEFFRGARVISARDGTNFLTSIGELTMRNTRRYGGYVVHFGMVLVFIGIAGTPFNRDIQKDLGYRRHAANRSLHHSLPEFRSSRQRQLPIATRYSGSLQKRQVGHDALSRAPFLPHQPDHRDDGRRSIVAPPRSLRSLRRTKPRERQSFGPRLFAAAREMDLVRRHRSRTRHDPGANPESPHRSGPPPCNRTILGQRHRRLISSNRRSSPPSRRP